MEATDEGGVSAMTTKKPRVCVLRAEGTNCDTETAYAFSLADGDPHLIHVNQLRAAKGFLRGFEILALPGGFSYGDDIASGKVLALELMSYLRDEINEFVSHGKLVIGICNGFQVLVRTGLLPFRQLGSMRATLTTNDSGHFECRWISMVVEKSPCVFTRGIERLTLPVAHGEGKFFTLPSELGRVEAQKLVALRYEKDGKETKEYPFNPNGSLNAIAGVCDASGRIFGLMPHPERFVVSTQYPNWRRTFIREPHGLPIFRNAVEFARDL